MCKLSADSLCTGKIKSVCSCAGPVHPDPPGPAGAQPVWRDGDPPVGAAQHAELAQREELRRRAHANGG